jgi:hypothetical protein
MQQSSISYSNDYPELKSPSCSKIITNKLLSIFNKAYRMDRASLSNYENEYRDVCFLIRQNKLEDNTNTQHRDIAYAMIAYIRDHRHGCGERDIAYMMVCVWYDVVDHSEAFNMITRWVRGFNKSRAIGCWKDIKYLSSYVKSRFGTSDHPIIQFCVQITIEQLMTDYLYILQQHETNIRDDNISMVAKWIPRENSSMHWLYEKLLDEWTRYNMPYLYANMYMSARNKACRAFRKWVSKINSLLGTKEIYECNKMWSNIDLDMISYKSLWDISLSETLSDNHDLLEYQQNARFRILTEYKPPIPLHEFVKKGCEILDASFCDPVEISIINYLWKKQLQSAAPLHAVIPFLNLQYDLDELCTSIHNIHICSAIGTACFISQKSLIPNRILFSMSGSQLTWINISDCHNFIDMLKEIRSYISQLNLHVSSSESSSIRISDSIIDGIEIIRHSIVNTCMDANQILTVIIHNHNDISGIDLQVKHRMIQQQHVVFWNMCNTSSLSSTKQIIYLSGNSPDNISYLSRLSMNNQNLTFCGYDILYHILTPYFY